MASEIKQWCLNPMNWAFCLKLSELVGATSPQRLALTIFLENPEKSYQLLHYLLSRHQNDPFVRYFFATTGLSLNDFTSPAALRGAIITKINQACSNPANAQLCTQIRTELLNFANAIQMAMPAGGASATGGTATAGYPSTGTVMGTSTISVPVTGVPPSVYQYSM